MFPVNENDQLFKVAHYELHRNGKCLNVEVSYCLAGETPGEFKADIVFDRLPLSEQFTGYGKSETAALRDCLAKIHCLSLAEICERDGWKQPDES